jgi:S-methylmethionine-dependent homocysteine/selenocysteine methylase
MSTLINDKNITILDGGMGRELKRIGAPFAQPEWSALSLIEAPTYVAQAHHNFINAGAQIITTNAYALVPFHIGEQRFFEHAYDLAQTAAKIARDCAKTGKVKVAGCLPPAFGSYQPDSFVADKAEEVLAPLIQAQEPFIDFWLIETASSIIEAETALNIIQKHSSKPIWLSFTLNNRHDMTQPPSLRSGETLRRIAPFLLDVDAILFNCSQPEEMEDAIKAIRALSPTIQIGAYANNFAEVKRKHKANEGMSDTRNDITPEAYLEFAKSWINAGASIIGGCCGISPDHIHTLSEHYKN